MAKITLSDILDDLRAADQVLRKKVMPFPSRRDDEHLIYTLPQKHPEIASSSLHLYTISLHHKPGHCHRQR